MGPIGDAGGYFDREKEPVLVFGADPAIQTQRKAGLTPFEEMIDPAEIKARDPVLMEVNGGAGEAATGIPFCPEFFDGMVLALYGKAGQ
jgi:hypothetical protein